MISARFAFLVLAGLSAMSSDLVRAADAPKGYDAFRLMQTRNIFDPNRRAAPSANAARTTERPRTRSSAFTLTGTMVTDSRTLAFFSGTRSDFSKVIPAGQSIGDFKVVAIAAGSVELEREGKRSTLAIGSQQQVDGKPGDPVEETAPPAGAAPATSPDAAPSAAPAGAPSAPAAPSSGSGPSDVLRRMMERRQKEMSK